MPTIHLKPIQTGDACYLQDHHNREGECLITVTMTDGCSTAEHAKSAILDAAEDRGVLDVDGTMLDGLSDAAQWCAEQWQLAKADMPAETDRDTEGNDSERYLECHILASWEV